MTKTDIVWYVYNFSFLLTTRAVPLSLTESVIDKFNYFPISNAQHINHYYTFPLPLWDPLLHVSMALIVFPSPANRLRLFDVDCAFPFILNNSIKCSTQNVSLLLLILYALNANHVQFKSENLQIINIRKSAVLVYLVINSSKKFHQMRKALSSSIIF